MTSQIKTYVDPRHRNIVFDGHEAGHFLTGYADALSACLRAVDRAALDQAVAAVEASAAAQGTVYFAGNGGSAAICA